jgi:hypothetical protein
VGLYLLAHNVGWIEISPWKALATLWPLFLVAIGLDLLLGRARLWAVLLVACLFTGVCLLLFQTDTFVHRAFRESPVEERTFEVPLRDAPAGVMDLDLDLGVLTVDALPEGSPLLALGKVRTDPDGRLEVGESAGDAGTRVAVIFDQRRHGPRITFPGFERKREMDLLLSRAVPLEVKVDLNAGTGDLDLASLRVHRVRADLNAGTGTVRLSPGIADGTAEFAVNVGTLDLVVPEGCAARLNAAGALATVEVDEARFPAGDGGYRSPDWDTAACRWDITVRGNLSTLTVR